MAANEPVYVVCRRGVFFLPDSIVESLSASAHNGVVYLREDAETMTISTSRITDGYRRQLVARFRAPMFRDATRLAIVNLNDSLRVMAVES